LNDNIDADEFKKLYNPLNLPGIFYICDYCQQNTIQVMEKVTTKERNAQQLPHQSSLIQLKTLTQLQVTQPTRSKPRMTL